VTTILLIRHAVHDEFGQVLSGRREGIPLSPEGLAQARALACNVADRGVTAVHSSPVQRARETAQEIASACGCAMEVSDALDEIDFGGWSGRRFADLAGDPRWEQWNTARETASPPGGESMKAAQMRVFRHLLATSEQYPSGTVVMVTHCDIVRAAVCAVLDLSLDRILSFDVDPGTITRISVTGGRQRLVSLNGAPYDVPILEHRRS